MLGAQRVEHSRVLPRAFHLGRDQLLDGEHLGGVQASPSAPSMNRTFFQAALT